MDLNRFTEQCQEALRRAQALAVRRNHQGIDAAHLLAALLEETDGLAAGCLAAAGIAQAPYVKGLTRNSTRSRKCPGRAWRRSRFILPRDWRVF